MFVVECCLHTLTKVMIPLKSKTYQEATILFGKNTVVLTDNVTYLNCKYTILFKIRENKFVVWNSVIFVKGMRTYMENTVVIKGLNIITTMWIKWKWVYLYTADCNISNISYFTYLYSWFYWKSTNKPYLLCTFSKSTNY